MTTKKYFVEKVKPFHNDYAGTDVIEVEETKIKHTDESIVLEK